MTWYKPYIVSAVSPNGRIIETREYILLRHARKRFKQWCGEYTPSQATILVWQEHLPYTNRFILYRPGVDRDTLTKKEW